MIQGVSKNKTKVEFEEDFGVVTFCQCFQHERWTFRTLTSCSKKVQAKSKNHSTKWCMYFVCFSKLQYIDPSGFVRGCGSTRIKIREHWPTQDKNDATWHGPEMLWSYPWKIELKLALLDQKINVSEHARRTMFSCHLVGIVRGHLPPRSARDQSGGWCLSRVVAFPNHPSLYNTLTIPRKPPWIRFSFWKWPSLTSLEHVWGDVLQANLSLLDDGTLSISLPTRSPASWALRVGQDKLPTVNLFRKKQRAPTKIERRIWGNVVTC